MQWPWRILIALTACSAIALLVWRCLPSEEALITRAKAALAQEQFAQARRDADWILWCWPRSTEALLIAGDACFHDQRPDDAIQYLDRLPGEGGKPVARGHMLAGSIHKDAGRLLVAEKHFRQASTWQPTRLEAHRELAHLLCLQERRWESVPYLLDLIKSREYTAEEFLLLCDLEYNCADRDEIDRYLELGSDDGGVLLAQACHAEEVGQSAEAERLLRRVIDDRPELLEAHARLGLLLHDRPQPFQAWRAALPANATSHPLIWIAFAKWAAANNQRRSAVRCYWEALKLDPNYRSACFQLGLLLAGSNENYAEPFRKRAGILNRMSRNGIVLWVYRRDATGMRQQIETAWESAELAKELGRYWEAAAYCQVIAKLAPGQRRAGDQRERLLSELTSSSPRTLDIANPVLEVDLSHYPMPQWSAVATEDGRKITASTGGAIAFRDLSAEAGLQFSYVSGHEEGVGRTLYQGLGGGVGVIDYDNDGWPDLYLTQGTPHRRGEPDAEFTDRLYRNLGNGRFEDVTVEAGLAENSYSHGVTVADYDNDGFSDLYIGNMGNNCLYRNNGDGTFVDVTRHSGISGNDWTTSCVMADLDGDTWPDIYDVNYVDFKNKDPYVLCTTDRGAPRRACPPNAFDAGQDRFLRNLGNGRFADQTTQAGIVQPHGYGLGILVARVPDSEGLSVLVANDTTANFWFVRSPSMAAGGLFDEKGVLSGLALDANGLPQGCMGIAAGDADGDGQLDMFVTNYLLETNTLYLGEQRQYVDSTRSSGLGSPSIKMVAFGTQFLDAQLDGLPDLIVANGHVDDFTYRDSPFKMRPQFFANQGAGRFAPVKAKSLGPYFRRQILGRGLARLDWNRDGKEDFVVSHLDEPAALMLNETADAGHFLAVELRGVISDRDAIGTIIRATCGGATYVRQLTAGDGYLASNQRQIVFGLGQCTEIEELTITWPSQSVQTFNNISADSHLLIVEGREDYVLCFQP